jgi:endoglucanase
VIVDWHTERAVDQQAQSIAFFTAMARKYGACPNVIYEDYNEPTGVTWAQIKPYHQAVVDAIRAVDADNLIIMGTPNWSQDVDLAAQSPVTGSNLLYTLHFYACSHTAWLRTKATTAIARGIGLFVTEFGATPANGGVAPDNTVCEAETEAWFSWMADNGVGGTAWKLSNGTDSSHLLTAAAPVEGPWTDNVLTTTSGSPRGHGLFVVNWMRR